MMLTRCKTCGKEFASETGGCPHCGTLECFGIKVDHLIILTSILALLMTMVNIYA